MEDAFNSPPNRVIFQSFANQILEDPQSGASTQRGKSQGRNHGDEQGTTPFWGQRITSLTHIGRERRLLSTQANETLNDTEGGERPFNRAPNAHLTSQHFRGTLDIRNSRKPSGQHPRGVLDTPDIPRSRTVSGQQTSLRTDIQANRPSNALQPGMGANQHPHAPSRPTAATSQRIAEIEQMLLAEGVQSMQSNVPFTAASPGLGMSHPPTGLATPLAMCTTQPLPGFGTSWEMGMNQPPPGFATPLGVGIKQPPPPFPSHPVNINREALPPGWGAPLRGLPSNPQYANGQFGSALTTNYTNAPDSYGAQSNQQFEPTIEVPPGAQYGFQTVPTQAYGQLSNASYGNARFYHPSHPIRQLTIPANSSQRGFVFL